MTDITTLYLSDYQSPEFTIETIDLTVDLSEHNTLITSTLLVKRLSDSATKLSLNGEQLTLKSIVLNGKVLTNEDYSVTDTLLNIAVDLPEFTLTIVTAVDPKNNSSLEGLYKSGDAFCTQCEAEGFRRITYYLDRPDVMAIFTCKVIADKQVFPYLLSNGNKVAQGDLADGKHFVQWYDPYPKPCYLFALVAGNFDLLTDSYTTSEGRDVTLEIYVDEGNLSKATHAMASLKRAMKWDEDTFDLVYDLDIYMIVAVDFFNMGAMENKGLNVFNSKFVLADEKSATDTDYFNIEAVIGHEYFHNWTGNRVTCRDWFQLSLKEGLTVFRDQQFSGDMHSALVTRIQNVRHLRSHQFAEDAGPMAHPIRPEKVIEMNNFYTLTVYEKGAEVIRMMHTLLGKDKFKAGIDLYFERFDGQAVTCDDFVDAMADASQYDLTQFKRWYSQSGTPFLDVVQSFNTETGEFSLTISQSNQGNEPLLIPVGIELITLNATENSEHATSELLTLSSAKQTFTFKGFEQAPIVAFLTDFSAPVKVNFNQSDDELATIMAMADDGFCRWDAGQKLLINYLKALTNDINIELPQSLIALYQESLSAQQIADEAIDKAFIAEQLVLPSFNEMSELIDNVNPLNLLAAIKKVKLFLAQGLEQQLLSTYKACNEALNNAEGKQVNYRALKNACLSYLSVFEQHQPLVEQQFEQASNMTDTLASLQSSANNNLSCFEPLMTTFEQTWQDNTLVMDKWFILQASLSSDDIFSRLTSLLAHPLFSLKNPNRARSLIGAFSQQNPEYFHSTDGRGYQFLAEQVKQLDAINPQVASRLITPLIQFKGFDKERQALMKSELVTLRKEANLSKDLIEKLDAAIV